MSLSELVKLSDFAARLVIERGAQARWGHSRDSEVVRPPARKSKYKIDFNSDFQSRSYHLAFAMRELFHKNLALANASAL
jgi:hypothetical protein